MRSCQKEQNLCFVKSLASALHYIRLKKGAAEINSVSEKYIGVPLNIAYDLVQKDMKKYVPIIGGGVPFNKWRTKSQNCNKRKRRRKIDIESLIEDTSIFPTIIIPAAKKMGVEHAVCIVDDLIFDSTQAFALTLSKESLESVNAKAWVESKIRSSTIHTACSTPIFWLLV